MLLASYRMFCSKTFVSIQEGPVRQARDRIASYRIDLVELRLALGD